MNIAIVGFDREGRASYEYFKRDGHQITVCDQNASLAIPEGVEAQLGPHYLDDLDQFDLIVRTPGLPPQHILAANPKVENKITSGTNEFLRACTTKNVIGITGTKGKGTTSTLTAKMLEAAGKKVWLGGNIGVPALSFIHDIKPDDWVVLELSSFQLTDLRYSPHIGVCLMMANDHLNWHGGFTSYAHAKQNMFAHQTAEDIAIYFSEDENSRAIAAPGDAQKIPYFTSPGAYVEGGFIKVDNQTVCQVTDIKLLGEHNQQNVCAALTVAWQVTHNTEALKSTISTFTGLLHRLELVREIDGVRFYNDSFASNPDAAIAAINAIPGRKVMLIGGFDRMLPLEPLIHTLNKNPEIIMVIFMGASAGRLATVSQTAQFSRYAIAENNSSLQDILQLARQYTQSGDNVILSPGFASFDMFKDFEDRGQQFKQAVEALV
jgi:UDP-N-acetylmuramoylalanine--D-glutamate ligase